MYRATHCLLDELELEMLVILRMSRTFFMEFMRLRYPSLARSLANQHFGQTLVEAETEE